MLVPLVVCFLLVGIVVDVLSVWMKIQVNKQLPDENRLSWWSRNYRQVNQIYGDQYPDSILPDLNRYGGYLAVALFGGMILAGLLWKD